MRVLIVQTYPGANETVFRHYPYYEASGADRIIGLVTEEGGCRWPTEDTVRSGPNRYAVGDHLPRRLLQSLELGLATGADEIAVIEYDVLFFKPLPPLTSDGIATVITGGTPEGYSCKKFFHVPWYMNAATARRVIAEGYKMISEGDIENGMPDCFFGRLVDRTGIPILENVFTRYTKNVIWPENFEEARAAFNSGVDAMHGVKTEAALDFITSKPSVLRMATGVTPNYLPKASPFLESLKKSNIESTLFAVNFDRDPPGVWHMKRVLVDYAKAKVQLPKFMLQHGGFVQFAPDHWKDSDVIIFTDADATLQRPFSEDELEKMARVDSGEFLVGYNWANDPETLLQEAQCLQPARPAEFIQSSFPGLEKMECRNFGFVVARLSGWKELFRRTLALEPACRACFQNPARVQFMACYAIQQPGLRFGNLSPVVHAHGHCGIKKGLEKRADGMWCQDGEVVAFAHAL